MTKESTTEHSEGIQVSKVHFLIHPGYLHDPATNRKEWENEEWALLMDQYLDQARAMPQDEIMIALLHARSQALINDYREGKAYIQKLVALKHILGNRLIALSDNSTSKGGSFVVPETYILVREIANRRGYYFDQSVESNVFGELHTVCVIHGGEAANRSLGLNHKTTIRPELTNMSSPSADFQAGVVRDFSRLQYPRRRIRRRTS